MDPENVKNAISHKMKNKHKMQVKSGYPQKSIVRCIRTPLDKRATAIQLAVCACVCVCVENSAVIIECSVTELCFSLQYVDIN